MKRTAWAAIAVIGLWAGGSQVLGQIPPFGGADAFRADLAARRGRALAALGPESVAIFWSAPFRVYSTDVNYEYRQDSSLLYLSGLSAEDVILVLVPGAKTKKAILFTPEADPRRELWNGHVMTSAETAAASGVDVKDVYPLSAFRPFIDGLLGGTGYKQAAEDAELEFGAVFAAVKQGTIKLAVAGGGPAGGRLGGRGAAPSQPAPPAMAPPSATPASPRAFADEMQQKYPGVTSSNVTPIVSTLRQLKTPYEQQLLRRSAEISAEAHVEGMKAARPGRWEYEVEAAIEYWYLKNGAMSWGYPSIVGSGPNATTLHYEASTRQMLNGDLLLVDAAANYQGLTADITRTYPVNGKFTIEQRAIYELVLAAQEAGIGAAQLGARSSDITAACRAIFGTGLLKLGLITDAASSMQISLWFPHGPTHGIGIDVHDPLGPMIAPGSAFVIEPGLYIRQDTLDNLPKTPENAKLIEAIQPAVTKYRNIGVRIEDSFLATDSGVVNLSVKAPRQIAALEKLVGTGK